MNELSNESKKLMKIAELNEKIEKLEKFRDRSILTFGITVSLFGYFLVKHDELVNLMNKDILDWLTTISGSFSAVTFLTSIIDSNERNSLNALKEYLELGEDESKGSDIKKLKLEPMEDNDGRIK